MGRVRWVWYKPFYEYLYNKEKEEHEISTILMTRRVKYN